jgi:hypothetical protein
VGAVSEGRLALSEIRQLIAETTTSTFGDNCRQLLEEGVIDQDEVVRVLGAQVGATASAPEATGGGDLPDSVLRRGPLRIPNLPGMAARVIPRTLPASEDQAGSPAVTSAPIPAVQTAPAPQTPAPKSTPAQPAQATERTTRPASHRRATGEAPADPSARTRPEHPQRRPQTRRVEKRTLGGERR